MAIDPAGNLNYTSGQRMKPFSVVCDAFPNRFGGSHFLKPNRSASEADIEWFGSSAAVFTAAAVAEELICFHCDHSYCIERL